VSQLRVAYDHWLPNEITQHQVLVSTIFNVYSDSDSVMFVD